MFQFVAVTLSIFSILMAFAILGLNEITWRDQETRKRESLYPGHGSGLAARLQAFPLCSRFSWFQHEGICSDTSCHTTAVEEKLESMLRVNLQLFEVKYYFVWRKPHTLWLWELLPPQPRTLTSTGALDCLKYTRPHCNLLSFSIFHLFDLPIHPMRYTGCWRW